VSIDFKEWNILGRYQDSLCICNDVDW